MTQFLSALHRAPFLAAGIGLVLLGGGRWARSRTTAVGVVWLLYAAYEIGMQQRWLCSGECNIRLDLLVIYPALFIGLQVARDAADRRDSRSGRRVLDNRYART
jgi:hypothetical protein